MAPRQVGRPRDEEKHLAILDAGWRLFLAQGIGATSIEAIATEAGVSKVTLYRHYPDKTALFRAAVERETERIEAVQRLYPEDGGPEPIGERLLRFGLGIMGFLTSDPAIDFYSAIAGELRRHPELARTFYEAGPGRTRANLAALIGEAAQRGELRVANPELAADALFGAWQGFTNFQLLLGIEVETIRRNLTNRVEHAVRSFVLAHGPAGG